MECGSADTMRAGQEEQWQPGIGAVTVERTWVCRLCGFDGDSMWTRPNGSDCNG